MMLRVTLIAISMVLIPLTEWAKGESSHDVDKFRIFNSRLTALEIFASDIKGRLSRAAEALFLVSPEFNGRKYYLSKNTGSAAIPVFETICELFGGYLVEINNEAEYRFVQRFIRNNPGDFFGVYTGGNDEAMEGNWVFRHSQEQVVYKDWTPGQPTNDIDGDCLILLNRNNWMMDDFRCYYDGKDTRFMCEIPVNKRTSP